MDDFLKTQLNCYRTKFSGFKLSIYGLLLQPHDTRRRSELRLREFIAVGIREFIAVGNSILRIE